MEKEQDFWTNLDKSISKYPDWLVRTLIAVIFIVGSVVVGWLAISLFLFLISFLSGLSAAGWVTLIKIISSFFAGASIIIAVAANVR